MEFTMPTTKAELYQVLGEIEAHYKGDLRVFSPPEFQTLTLRRMEYTPLTEEEIRARAALLTAYDYEEALARYLAERDAEIALLEKEKKERLAASEAYAEAVNEAYLQAAQTVKTEATKRGILNSSAVTERLAALAEEREAKLVKEQEECALAIADADSKRARLTQQKEDAPTVVKPPFESAREKVVLELEKLDWDRRAEVLKQNNQAEEKEVKYANSLLTVVARLKVEFLQAAANGYSEDQLLAMGYYKDAIAAVLGFYETMTPAAASADFNEEKALMLYLGSFYNSVSYYLSQRAAQA